MFVKKHGLSKTKIYKVWKTIRLKCYGSNIDNRYKGEDLWICKEWKDDPVAFVNWAKENGYEEGLQLVRKDKNKGFYPENCVFLQKEETTKTHGMRYSRLYRIWTLMNQRCTNQKLSYYERYGGRGIQVCEEWKTFEVFAKWANKNGYREDLSIDRIDPNGNYEPNNCKWSTEIEQARNKRTSRFVTINGESKTVAEWAETSKIPYKTLQRRIDTGCKEENLLASKGYQHNLLEINGVRKTMNTWAKESGLPFSTIKRRFEKGIRGRDLLAKGRLGKKHDNQLSFDL
ncbi:hypothetical protein [Peribacillus acanthi]|uniref:hypothetical protein n=1 Tax=Peribacillus acanthi TaxID=2171554 RepID=UPI000D3E0FE3|nr:hypothetical protein [Peribacillus acanthi]